MPASSLRYIFEAIAKHSNIVVQSPQDQWHQLVLGPLSKLDGNSSQSYILVVDALDECDDKNDCATLGRSSVVKNRPVTSLYDGSSIFKGAELNSMIMIKSINFLKSIYFAGLRPLA